MSGYEEEQANRKIKRMKLITHKVIKSAPESTCVIPRAFSLLIKLLVNGDYTIVFTREVVPSIHQRANDHELCNYN